MMTQKIYRRWFNVKNKYFWIMFNLWRKSLCQVWTFLGTIIHAGFYHFLLCIRQTHAFFLSYIHLNMLMLFHHFKKTTLHFLNLPWIHLSNFLHTSCSLCGKHHFLIVGHCEIRLRNWINLHILWRLFHRINHFSNYLCK